MTLRILISLSLLLLWPWQKAGAQLAPAADFFNSGAQLYISNNIPAALERVELGRKTYPDDKKLKDLEQLLKQEQQQQQQQQSQQNQSQQQQQQQQQQKNQQQQQNQQNQSSPDKQKQDQQKQDEQKQQEEKQAEQQKEADQQKQPSPEPQVAQKPPAEKSEKPEGEPVKAGQITPEEARRLLDARKGDEQLLQMKPKEKPRNPARTIKDW